jgi:hypothetical protein
MRQVTPAMLLNFVEARKQFGQSRNTYDGNTPGPNQGRNSSEGGPVIIDMLDNVQRQDSVAQRSDRRQILR